jgi:YbgC/YbaW family acyl-CoA thioester hydrolase
MSLVLYRSHQWERCLNTSDLDGYIRDGHHHMKVRVYFEDTDFTGITYHANYLRFMERGRTNYLRLLGASHRDLFEETTSRKRHTTPIFAATRKCVRAGASRQIRTRTPQIQRKAVGGNVGSAPPLPWKLGF